MESEGQGDASFHLPETLRDSIFSYGLGDLSVTLQGASGSGLQARGSFDDAALEALLVDHERRVCEGVSAALVVERRQLKCEVAALFEQVESGSRAESKVGSPTKAAASEPGSPTGSRELAQIIGKRHAFGRLDVRRATGSLPKSFRRETRQASIGARGPLSDDDEDSEPSHSRARISFHAAAQRVVNLPVRAPDSVSEASSAETDVINQLTYTNFKVDRMPTHNSVMGTSLAVDAEDDSNTRYELIMGGLILANAVFLGVQVNQAAGNEGENTIPMRSISAAFALLFFFDLVLRVCKLGLKGFVCGTRKYLNLLDAVVVFFMFFELALAPPWSDEQAGELHNISVLRICRIARLTRLVRFVRVASVFSELHVLIYALQKSWRILGWVLIMIGATLYITALFLTMAAPDQCGESADREAFCEHFGDLRRSLLSCFLTMYGGIDWGMLLEALAEVSVLYSVFFALFLTFAFTILANLVTGIFLQLMRESTNDEKQLLVNSEMRRIMNQIQHLEGAFIEIDVNQSGTISKDELEMAIRDPRMASLLSALNLELSDTAILFELLDIHHVGAVNINEFVDGCMRLTGDARAVHFQAVRLDLKVLERKIRRLDEKLFGRKRRSTMSLKQEKEDERASRPGVRRAGQQSGLEHLLKHQMSDIWGTSVAIKDHQPIALAEHRAMSLFELRNVWRVVQAHCVQEEWRDPVSGRKLAPDDVNLYTFSYNHICPKGAVGGVTLVGLTGLDTELMRVTLQVEQRDTKWALPMASGFVDRFDKDGDPVIVVTHGRFESMASTYCHVFIGDVDCGVPTEVRPELALSYKELISNGPLKPQWFCSHWWGMSIIDFVMNCVQHHEYRQCEYPSYWVCGYANRQYELGIDLDVDPENSSFNRAMALAKGMLLHLDQDATPLSRIWCDFEIYRTLKTEKLLDIATAVRTSHRAAVSKRVTRLLTDGHKDSETTFAKMQRESSFPVEIFIKGMTTCLEDGQSTVESDKARIMRTILRMAVEDYEASGQPLSPLTPMGRLERFKLALAGKSLGASSSGSGSAASKLTKSNSWMMAATDSHTSASAGENCGGPCESSGGTGSDPAEEQLVLEHELLQINSALHGYFARAAWPQAVRLKTFDDFDAGNPRSLKLSDVVARDHHLKKLTLTLAHVPNVSDSALQAIGRGLPPQLSVLQLSFEGCGHVGDSGVAHLAGRLPSTLGTLALDFSGCRKLTDRSVKDVARSLPDGLVDLKLVFASCPLLTMIGVEALSKSVPQGLRTCLVTFVGTEVNKNFRSVHELRACLSKSSPKSSPNQAAIKASEFAR